MFWEARAFIVFIKFLIFVEIIDFQMCVHIARIRKNLMVQNPPRKKSSPLIGIILNCSSLIMFGNIFTG